MRETDRNDLKPTLCRFYAASGGSISDFQGHKKIKRVSPVHGGNRGYGVLMALAVMQRPDANAWSTLA